MTEVGARVGPYTLLGLLGRGGFSEVWRAARDDGSGPEVALKLLVHPEHVNQLRAEATARGAVRGEGIVPILDMDLDHEPPYLALGLMPGGDLRMRMTALRKADRLGAVEAVDAMTRILLVLSRVHKEGVVHGDLKPENVLLDAKSNPFLTDFGLSRRLSSKTATLSVSLSRETAAFAGTLDYMAPEQREGEKPTARSDVYAAGVLLYELLTGERPQGVFALPSERDPRCPPVIDRTLAIALAKDPSQRFSSAGAMLSFLHTGLDHDWRELTEAHATMSRLIGAMDPKSIRLAAFASGWPALAFIVGTLMSLAGRGVGPRLSYERLVDVERLAVFLATQVGILVGVVLVFEVFFRGNFRRREERLKKLRSKIEIQIASRKSWPTRADSVPRPKHARIS